MAEANWTVLLLTLVSIALIGSQLHRRRRAKNPQPQAVLPTPSPPSPVASLGPNPKDDGNDARKERSFAPDQDSNSSVIRFWEHIRQVHFALMLASATILAVWFGTTGDAAHDELKKAIQIRNFCDESIPDRIIREITSDSPITTTNEWYTFNRSTEKQLIRYYCKDVPTIITPTNFLSNPDLRAQPTNLTILKSWWTNYKTKIIVTYPVRLIGSLVTYHDTPVDTNILQVREHLDDPESEFPLLHIPGRLITTRELDYDSFQHYNYDFAIYFFSTNPLTSSATIKQGRNNDWILRSSLETNQQMSINFTPPDSSVKYACKVTTTNAILINYIPGITTVDSSSTFEMAFPQLQKLMERYPTESFETLQKIGHFQKLHFS